MSDVAVSVQAQSADLESWLDLARRVEDAGFDALLVADHPGSGPEPWQCLAAAATVTSTLRLGTYVVQAGVRTPHHIAAEALTLDLFAPGRVILGIGAGHTPAEWEAVGLSRPSPGDRVTRLVESVHVIKRLLTGETVDLEGEHVLAQGAFLERLGDAGGNVTLLIGGGNRRLLQLAAEEADIVGLSGLGRTLADGHHHEARWRADQIRGQLELVRHHAESAGRAPALEVLVQRVAMTSDRDEVLAAIADDIEDLTVDDASSAPYLLVGTSDEMVTQLQRQAVEHGITRCVIRSGDIDTVAPLLPSLRNFD
jgi:probable F420-dependent oxidoreductase